MLRRVFCSYGLRVVLAWVLLGPACLVPLAGQEVSPAQAGAEESASDATPDPLEALRSVRDSLRLVEGRISEVSASLDRANPSEAESLAAELKELSSRREVLQTDFESIATGIDPADYEKAPPGGFVLKEELDELLRPIVDELKSLTATAREIETLRSELELWKGRRETAGEALAQLERLPEVAEPGLAEALAATREKWDERHQLAEGRVGSLSYQLGQLEKARPSFYEAARDGLRDFFRTRGLNFLLAVFAFGVAFLLLRFLHRRLQLHAPWMRGPTRPFYARLVDVVLALLSVAGAAAAALFVLYATGDWVLMGIAVILLAGLALAARSGLPRIYEDARLLLNLGEVREGERVVFEGIPWRIESLSFFTLLKNERLRGGLLRLPVRRLAGMVSRPSAEGELWFPTEEGDWVDLPGHGLARVVSQSPEWVQLVELGGARIALATADFLAAAATNLSKGFRLSSRFGIGYRHQISSTTSIPEILEAHLLRHLGAVVGDRDLLRSLKVEFAEAGASSLDYAIIADFDGSLAARREFLARALQRLAVDCCNEQGWEIPFTQITVHQADAPEEG